MYITLEEAKKHLNIDTDFTDDDAYITTLIAVSEDAVSKNIDKALSDCLVDGELTPSIKQSILLLIGNLYNNREAVTYGAAIEVPYAFKYLINLNRHFSVK